MRLIELLVIDDGIILNMNPLNLKGIVVYVVTHWQ